MHVCFRYKIQGFAFKLNCNQSFRFILSVKNQVGQP